MSSSGDQQNEAQNSPQASVEWVQMTSADLSHTDSRRLTVNAINDAMRLLDENPTTPLIFARQRNTGRTNLEIGTALHVALSNDPQLLDETGDISNEVLDHVMAQYDLGNGSAVGNDSIPTASGEAPPAAVIAEGEVDAARISGVMPGEPRVVAGTGAQLFEPVVTRDGRRVRDLPNGEEFNITMRAGLINPDLPIEFDSRVITVLETSDWGDDHGHGMRTLRCRVGGITSLRWTTGFPVVVTNCGDYEGYVTTRDDPYLFTGRLVRIQNRDGLVLEVIRNGSSPASPPTMRLHVRWTAESPTRDVHVDTIPVLEDTSVEGVSWLSMAIRSHSGLGMAVLDNTGLTQVDFGDTPGPTPSDTFEFHQGFEAHEAGVRLHDNPYAHMTGADNVGANELHQRWADGWIAANSGTPRATEEIQTERTAEGHLITITAAGETLSLSNVHVAKNIYQPEGYSRCWEAWSTGCRFLGTGKTASRAVKSLYDQVVAYENKKAGFKRFDPKGNYSVTYTPTSIDKRINAEHFALDPTFSTGTESVAAGEHKGRVRRSIE
jgi:hypothetical protein